MNYFSYFQYRARITTKRQNFDSNFNRKGYLKLIQDLDELIEKNLHYRQKVDSMQEFGIDHTVGSLHNLKNQRTEIKDIFKNEELRRGGFYELCSGLSK